VLVPIGGGSGASGCCLVRTALGSRARIIGIQAERADAVTRSWRSHTRVVGDSADTFAEGMATRVTFDLTFSILEQEHELYPEAVGTVLAHAQATQAANS